MRETKGDAMSLVQSDQPRQPGGAPEGGQFARRTNAAPEGILAENATGSFAFPPRAFESVDEYVEFFETAPISDRILSNADHAYRKWRLDRISAEVREAYRAYSNDPNVVRGAKKNPLISDREAQAFVQNARADAESKLPQRSIDAHRLRNVLRAHQMWSYAGILPWEGARDQVLNHNLLGSEWLVQGIVESNSTPEWADRALTDSDLAAVDAMRKIVRTLDDHAGFDEEQADQTL